MSTAVGGSRKKIEPVPVFLSRAGWRRYPVGANLSTFVARKQSITLACLGFRRLCPGVLDSKNDYFFKELLHDSAAFIRPARTDPGGLGGLDLKPGHLNPPVTPPDGAFAPSAPFSCARVGSIYDQGSSTLLLPALVTQAGELGVRGAALGKKFDHGILVPLFLPVRN
jgi:hypothetical protein